MLFMRRTRSEYSGNTATTTGDVEWEEVDEERAEEGSLYFLDDL